MIAAYRDAMFVSLPGFSPAARKEKIGYQVMRLVMKDGRITGAEDFIAGWSNDGQVVGRPAGLITAADGARDISDDNKGLIYRVTSEPK